MRDYLIYIGDYVHRSAGVRVMHRLCHLLNTKAGARAYVWGKPNPDWHEKRLSEEQRHRNAHKDMIVVYPEVTMGNPLGCEHVARFVLNVPGLLGGSKAYDPNEQVFVYGKDLNKYLPSPAPQLWVPPIERDLFFDAGKDRDHTDGLYWIGKSQLRDPMPPKTFSEITYHWPSTRDNLALLLQEAPLFYSYDNYTCLISEARLCGCPVVLLPDGRFTRQEYQDHFGPLDGIAWGVRGREYARARATVGAYSDYYAWQEANFWLQFEHFVETTQKTSRLTRVC